MLRGHIDVANYGVMSRRRVHGARSIVGSAPIERRSHILHATDSVRLHSALARAKRRRALSTGSASGKPARKCPARTPAAQRRARRGLPTRQLANLRLTLSVAPTPPPRQTKRKRNRNRRRTNNRTDINECEIPSLAALCSDNSECCNLPGHFVCKCKPGYQQAGQSQSLLTGE